MTGLSCYPLSPLTFRNTLLSSIPPLLRELGDSREYVLAAFVSRLPEAQARQALEDLVALPTPRTGARSVHCRRHRTHWCCEPLSRSPGERPTTTISQPPSAHSLPVW